MNQGANKFEEEEEDENQLWKSPKDRTLCEGDQDKGIKCLIDSSILLKVNSFEELKRKYLDTIFKSKSDEQKHPAVPNNSGLISIQRCRRTLS